MSWSACCAMQETNRYRKCEILEYYFISMTQFLNIWFLCGDVLMCVMVQKGEEIKTCQKRTWRMRMGEKYQQRLECFSGEFSLTCKIVSNWFKWNTDVFWAHTFRLSCLVLHLQTREKYVGQYAGFRYQSFCWGSSLQHAPSHATESKYDSDPVCQSLRYQWFDATNLNRSNIGTCSCSWQHNIIESTLWYDSVVSILFFNPDSVAKKGKRNDWQIRFRCEYWILKVISCIWIASPGSFVPASVAQSVKVAPRVPNLAPGGGYIATSVPNAVRVPMASKIERGPMPPTMERVPMASKIESHATQSTPSQPSSKGTTLSFFIRFTLQSVSPTYFVPVDWSTVFKTCMRHMRLISD